MPADFDACVAEGGRVRTINIKGNSNKYMHICYKDGLSHHGEIKTKNG